MERLAGRPTSPPGEQVSGIKPPDLIQTVAADQEVDTFPDQNLWWS